MDGATLVTEHGMLLQSAKGPIPSLPAMVVGSAIRGSWWSHPRHDEIFRVLNEAAASPDVVRLRLVGGKVTLVHRRLWPALVRVADELGPDRLASVEEEHTTGGTHRTHRIPFPDWVPAEVMAAARALTPTAAWSALPACLRSSL